MKTGINTTVYFKDGTREIDLAHLKSHGYDCVDYDISFTKDFPYNLPEAEFAGAVLAEKKRVEEAGLTVSQLHGPWPVDDTTPEARADKMEKMKISVRACALLGCPYMVVHPVMPYGWDKEDDFETSLAMNVEFFSALCDYAAPFGVSICAENMPMLAHKMSRMESIVRLVRTVNKPNLFICLDTGHCQVFKDDPGEMVRLCRDYLRVLHVHDTLGTRDNHMIPFAGYIDWDNFTAALKEIGFKGVMSIETGVGRKYPGDMREYMLVGLAKIAKELAKMTE